MHKTFMKNQDFSTTRHTRHMTPLLNTSKKKKKKESYVSYLHECSDI